MQAFETELVGKRQSLADVISNIQVTSNPFTSMLQKRTKPKNQPHSWQAEVYPNVDHEGVPDGKDVDVFDSQARLLLQSYSQKFWRNPAVSDFADEAEVAGLSGGEMARQKATAMILLKRKMEQRFLSASDTGLSNAKVYETRGMFEWIKSTAQATFPVPAGVLTPAAQIYSGTLANFKERGTTSFATMCASSFIQRKGPMTMDAFLGIYLKQAFTEFTQYQETKALFTAVRQFNMAGDAKTLTNTIDQLVTDTGTYRLHTSAFLRKTTAGDDVAGTHLSGIVVDMDMVALAYTRLPKITPLENKGGGPRAMCDAIALCMCDNPSGMMKMQIDS